LTFFRSPAEDGRSSGIDEGGGGAPLVEGVKRFIFSMAAAGKHFFLKQETSYQRMSYEPTNFDC
jgi:hypothetical protein